MVVMAYILVQTEVGKAAQVAKDIIDIPGVQEARAVTGPYDVIVRAEAQTIDELGQLVVARVQAVNGITRTLPVRSSASSSGQRVGGRPAASAGSQRIVAASEEPGRGAARRSGTGRLALHGDGGHAQSVRGSVACEVAARLGCRHGGELRPDP